MMTDKDIMATNEIIGTITEIVLEHLHGIMCDGYICKLSFKEYQIDIIFRSKQTATDAICRIIICNIKFVDNMIFIDDFDVSQRTKIDYADPQFIEKLTTVIQQIMHDHDKNSH